MADAKANQAQFFLFVSGLDRSTFRVADFRGTDRISAPYRFDVTLLASDATIAPADVVNRRASLFMFRSGEYYPYSGIVSAFSFVDRSTDYCVYRLRLAPALWLLGLNQQSRVFQNMTVPDVVQAVLDDAGLSDFCDVKVSGSYPAREFVVQYQESDLNFVSRLMEGAGISYCFREQPLVADEMDGTPVTETLVITDTSDTFKDVDGNAEIVYRSASGMTERMDDEATESIDRLTMERCVVPKEVFVKNYNYRTPETAPNATAMVTDGHAGTHHEYGGDFRDSDGAQAAAKRAATSLGLAGSSVAGAGNCRGLRAGRRFSITGHTREDLNDTYLLTRVTHAGSHNQGERSGRQRTYENTFRGLLAAHASTYVPPRRAVVPRVGGIFTAAIETNGSDYAALDDMGRYKVRLPFDLSDAKNSEASKYLRLAQPYSGSSYGLHFPSHEGVEMVLACVNGDPDKPLGLGTVPNANTVSPVTSANKEQSLIRTAGGNELLMDDTDGSQVVRLASAAGSVLELNDDAERAALQSAGENALVLDDKNEVCSIKSGDHSITLTAKSGKEAIVITSAGGHVVSIDDKNKRVTIQTKAGHIIQMDDQAKTLSLSDCSNKNTVTLDGNKGLALESNGEISIKATKDLTIRAANVKVSTTSGSIEAKATQDLKLQGMKASIKASAGDVKIEGLNVGIKATMKATMEGSVGVEIKSNLQTKVSGTMTELSSKAVTTVKGGVVMIN
jgi:type VI secretion system secreted protein VgrG